MGEAQDTKKTDFRRLKPFLRIRDAATQSLGVYRTRPESLGLWGGLKQQDLDSARAFFCG